MALGKTIRELHGGPPGMDAKEFNRWRRFYARHPFGIYRGDLQAWLVARNLAEVSHGGRLRAPDRAALGVSKHKPATARRPGDWRKIKTRVTRERMEQDARESGVRFVPGPAVSPAGAPPARG